MLGSQEAGMLGGREAGMLGGQEAGMLGCGEATVFLRSGFPASKPLACLIKSSHFDFDSFVVRKKRTRRHNNATSTRTH